MCGGERSTVMTYGGSMCVVEQKRLRDPLGRMPIHHSSLDMLAKLGTARQGALFYSMILNGAK